MFCAIGGASGGAIAFYGMLRGLQTEHAQRIQSAYWHYLKGTVEGIHEIFTNRPGQGFATPILPVSAVPFAMVGVAGIADALCVWATVNAIRNAIKSAGTVNCCTAVRQGLMATAKGSAAVGGCALMTVLAWDMWTEHCERRK